MYVAVMPNRGSPPAILLRESFRENGTLLPYDMTSTWLEGRRCELARYGYSRDPRRDRPQLVIGLFCAADGCPVAVEVFEGNIANSATLAGQHDRGFCQCPRQPALRRPASTCLRSSG